MDWIIVAGIALLALWGAGTWFEAPGWIHLLLTVGVSLILWRVATRPQTTKNKNE